MAQPRSSAVLSLVGAGLQFSQSKTSFIQPLSKALAASGGRSRSFMPSTQTHDFASMVALVGKACSVAETKGTRTEGGKQTSQSFCPCRGIAVYPCYLLFLAAHEHQNHLP